MKEKLLHKHSFRSRTNDLIVTGWWRDHTSDYNTLHSIVTDDEYMLSVLAQPGGTLVDIGAHIGSVSCFCAKRGMKVVAVEPLPENYTLLKKNIEANGLAGHDITILEDVALGGVDSEEKVQNIWYGDPSNPSGESDQFIGRPAPLEGMSLETDFHSVRTVSLATVFEQGNVERCSLLKVDCEGSEWEVFDGIPDEILEKTDLMIAELHCMVPQAKGRNRDDFVDLFRGILVEVPEYAAALPGSPDLSHVMMRHPNRELSEAEVERLASLYTQYRG